MKPPYEITALILDLYGQISEKLGQCRTLGLSKPEAKLRRQNRIKTIHSSLAIEGNSLAIDDVTALLDNNRVIGPVKEIREVKNAITAYEQIGKYSHLSQKDFLVAHRALMDGLIPEAGKYRRKAVGIVKGQVVRHIAPAAEMVPSLMKDLFKYLQTDKDLLIIKSCVFHYEMEFIHPFEDGNGRMGRLWQTRILMAIHPVFEYVPVEETIRKKQVEYYKALEASDSSGKSTVFIEFMLSAINESLGLVLGSTKAIKIDLEKRYEKALDEMEGWFDRKKYMQINKGISGATASRDLKAMVERGLVETDGIGRMKKYRKRTRK